MQSVLRFNRVRFTYRNSDKPALQDISLELEEGEFFALMGPNGAGKSTLCFCMNGLIPHAIKGEVMGERLLWGNSIDRMDMHETARLTSMVFQDFESQLFSTNVRLEMAFGPENLGKPPEIIETLVQENLDRVGLAGMEYRQPAYLSGGQKQRLAIGSVLTINPGLFILDEPTTDLDPVGKTDIFRILNKLRLDTKRTMFMVDHDIEEMMYADRIGILKDGKLVDIGKPSELLKDCARLSGMGVRPPQLLQIAQSLGLPGEEPECQALYNQMHHKGYCLNTQNIDDISMDEKKRANRYGNTIIEMSGVQFAYEDGNRILDHINLTVRAGEFIALAGQNGSGKTTLAKHLNGLLKPSAGEIRIHGKPIGTYTSLEMAHLVGYVFQNPDHQIFQKTVFEETAFSPRITGITGQELESRVMNALRSVGLEDLADADPFLLPKGGRQRVAVASLLAAQCDVLVFDEPTTGLDYTEIRKMMRLIRTLNDEGKTIIIITHNMHVVAEYAHRIIALKEGRIVMDMPVREAFTKNELMTVVSLKPPQVTLLGMKMGFPVLTVQEFLDLVRQTQS